MDTALFLFLEAKKFEPLLDFPCEVICDSTTIHRSFPWDGSVEKEMQNCDFDRRQSPNSSKVQSLRRGTALPDG